MKIQEVLGFPLKEGQKFFEEHGIAINIIETFAKNNNIKSLNKDLKNPHILRVREMSNDLIEVLVSYF